MPLSNTPTTAPRTDLPIGTTQGTVAAGNDSRLTGALQARNNLSDLASPLDARTALSLGTAALLDREDLAAPADVARAVTNAVTGLQAQLDQLRAENERLTQILELHAAAITNIQQTPPPPPGIPALPPRLIPTVPPIGNGPAGIRAWAEHVTPAINNLILLAKSLNLVE